MQFLFPLCLCKIIVKLERTPLLSLCFCYCFWHKKKTIFINESWHFAIFLSSLQCCRSCFILIVNNEFLFPFSVHPTLFIIAVFLIVQFIWILLFFLTQQISSLPQIIHFSFRLKSSAMCTCKRQSNAVMQRGGRSCLVGKHGVCKFHLANNFLTFHSTKVCLLLHLTFCKTLFILSKVCLKQ